MTYAIIALVFALVFNSGDSHWPFFLKAPTCNTTTCQIRAVNGTIKPCDNFYEFSCNIWMGRAEKPSFEPVWNPWMATSHEISRRLADILQTVKAPELEQAEIFFNACKSASLYEAKYVKSLKLLIDNLGGWPLVTGTSQEGYDWLKATANVAKFLGIHPILKFHIDLDYRNPTEYILYIEPGDLIFPHYILVNPDKFATEIGAYEKWIFETVRHLYNKSHYAPGSGVGEIVQFEVILAKIRANRPKNERIPIGKLAQKIPANWISAINILFHDHKIALNETVVVKNYYYVKSLFLLLKKTPTRVVEDYLMWATVKDLSRETSDIMRNLNFVIDKAILGVQSDLNREFECVSKTIHYFSHALVPEYLKRHQKVKSFSIIETMVKSIKKEFVRRINENRWLSKEAKLLSVEKVENIRYFLGFPQWISAPNSLNRYYKTVNLTSNHFLNVLKMKNFIIEKELRKSRLKPQIHWPSTPFDVNAYYSILQNAIFVPLGLLESPFFEPRRPPVFNYGALGSLIGHELSHSLDNVGIRANQDGKIAKWWPTADAAKFKSQIECFETNDLSAMEENIADIEGLNLSLGAYLRHGSKRKPLKLFFISFAQMWCEISEDTDIFNDEEHSIVRERVSRTLNNNKYFKDAFNCDKTSNECLLW